MCGKSQFSKGGVRGDFKTLQYLSRCPCPPGMLLSQQYWGQGGFRKFIHKKGPRFLARGLVSFVVFVTYGATVSQGT